MSSECKLCALLGATTLNDSLDGNQVAHSELHAHQLDLIGLNHNELSIDKTPRNGSLISDGSGTYPKEKSKKNSLFRVCRELIKIYGKDGGIKCSQCKISIRLQRCTNNTPCNIINHACIHLNKDLFACRQCHLKFVSRSGVYRHLQSIHSLSSGRANYVDMMDDHLSEIMDMVKLCFGTAPQKQLNVTPFGQQKRNMNIQGQVTLLELSYNFTAMHQGGDHIQCNLCARFISNKIRNVATRTLLDHARWHVDKPIFTCRLCQYSASTEATMRAHLTKIHSVAGSKQNFKDGSSEYLEDISSMLKECFGEMKKDGPSVNSQKQKRYPCRIISKMHGKGLKAARHIRAIELIKNHAKDGKIVCLICSQSTTVTKRRGSRSVFIHAMSHLDKRFSPYRCKLCQYVSVGKSYIRYYHLQKVHKNEDANEFEDVSDKFHSEIMECLSKCYDRSVESG